MLQCNSQSQLTILITTNENQPFELPLDKVMSIALHVIKYIQQATDNRKRNLIFNFKSYIVVSPSRFEVSGLNFISLTVLSLLPVAMRSPTGDQAMQQMEPLWCLVRLNSTVGWYVVWSSLNSHKIPLSVLSFSCNMNH